MPEKQCQYKDLLLLLLAIIFSLALMFAFIELPRLIDLLLQQHVGFPGFDQGGGHDAIIRSEVFINSLYLRWIGYACLLLVCLFTLVGFITRKSSWAWAGAIVIFLPVFGQFALSMFYLSGLGILRTAWLPLMEVNLPVLDLGKVIYVPYWILLWFFGLFQWYAKDFISWFFMATGSFIFVWGVFVWFQSRFGNKGVATRWIYKLSRHPQYLGWIIWSYGIMIFSSTENNMKKTWVDSTSFPWLIASMIIVAICMLEELSMRNKYGEEYDSYREKTPFLLPLPKWTNSIIAFPAKLFTTSNFPETRKQVAGIVLTYTLIFMAISLCWVDIGRYKNVDLNNQTISQNMIDSISGEIYNTIERREMYKHFMVLGKAGDAAVGQLLLFLKDSDPVKREFAADQLGIIKSDLAVTPLIAALNDQSWRVSISSGNALANIGDQQAIEPIMALLRSTPRTDRFKFYSILGNLKSEKAWPFLIEDINNSHWYIRNSIIQALCNINPEKAKPFLYNALKDDDVHVQRNAVFIILEQTPEDALIPLQQVLNDDDFETRFYAKQAVKRIKKKCEKP